MAGQSYRNASSSIHIPPKLSLDEEFSLSTAELPVDTPIQAATFGDQPEEKTNLRLVADHATNFSNFNLKVFSCEVGCGCRCHRRRALTLWSLSSPRIMESILGRVFLGYHASPQLRQSCDLSTCGKKFRRITFVYTFPSWLMKRIIFGTMTSNPFKGPELILKVKKMRESLTLADLAFPAETDTSYGRQAKIICKLQQAIDSNSMSVDDATSSRVTDLHVRDCLFSVTVG